MTTPDGITTADWDRATELSMQVWRHIDDPVAEERCRRELLAYLDVLEAKYGPLPSIIATRADFLSADLLSKREELLVRAYALALERRDRVNALFISHSLADMYLDELRQPGEGGRWLVCFGTLLYEDPEDQWWSQEYERLKKLARELEAGSE